IAGLNWDKQDEILILPRSAKLFPGGVEFHAFMFSRCLSEYLFHYETIHAGIYRGSGLFSGVPQSVPINAPIAFSPGRAIILEKAEPSHAKAASPVEVAALESGNMKYFRKRQISPDRFSLVQRTAEQNGLLGEEFVLDHERKSLRRAGRADLADVVKWVSRISVCEGFDILSYSANGEEKWIEVKSTAGKSRVFEMSDNEWQTCSQAGTKYFIYRVTSVTSGKPSLEIVQNPAALEAGGQISKTPTGWRVTLR
ncbi:DUF3883 domain-containing protein, partial [Candidatus Woesearchaeota archaeon]|nr:DUF3883 domain-containing protein [Candidatus Woesearchaeota archaeon]